MSDLKTQLGLYLEHVIEPVVIEDISVQRALQPRVQPLATGISPRPIPSWALLLGGAAIVVALFLVPLVIRDDLGPLDQSPGSDSTVPSNLEVARQVLTALSAHDAVTMRSLLTENALFGGDWDVRPENLETWLEFDRVRGLTYDVGQCLEDSPGLFRCYYDISNDLSRALAIGPYEGGHFVVVVENGKVAALINIEQGVETLYEEAALPFMAWVEERDPEAARIMEGELTSEALALWERYVDEFVADMTGE